jgi:hypothetical protein
LPLQGGTAAEVGVEPVEDVDSVLELAQLDLAERRLERPADVALIRDAGAQLVVRDLNPAVEQVRDRGRPVRDPFGLDLGDQPVLGALGRLAGLGERDPSCQNSCQRPSMKIE